MAIDFSATRSAHDDSQSPIGKGWVQGVALVLVFGFLAMGFLRLSRSPAGRHGSETSRITEGATSTFLRSTDRTGVDDTANSDTL